MTVDVALWNNKRVALETEVKSLATELLDTTCADRIRIPLDHPYDGVWVFIGANAGEDM